MNRIALGLALLAVFNVGEALAIAPTIGGCPVFPANSHWNTRVDNLPLHASSATWVTSVGTTRKLHADWGNVLADNYGIPFVTVPDSQPKIVINYDPNGAGDESDPGLYPIPPDAPIEGGPSSTGDRHVLVVDTGTCVLYELDEAYPQVDGSWTTYSSVMFNMRSHALRTAGLTSADAAGLPILPGLVRYDEVAAGEIAHAIRFTANLIWGNTATGHKWLWPARHWSGGSTDSTRPPMGAHFRLKANFDVSSYNPQVQVILRAMKKYGLILADGGSDWYFQGVSDTRWLDSTFSQLGTIAGSNFEVVDASVLQLDVNSGQALQLQQPATSLEGDARSDILYRNGSSGQLFRMLMDGFVVRASTTAFTEPNTAWQVIREGDFNGDGVTDLLWRNSTTGQVFYQPWGYNGLPSGGTVFYTEPSAAWKIVATPDIDGDGRSDIVWRNSTTGQVYAMLMNGGTIAASAIVYTEPDANWQVVSSGDFAGSGRQNQLLWRNAATGQVYLMTLTYTGGTWGVTGQTIYTEPNLMWKIVGVADFNADGKSDILWRNDSTGQVYMMLMNGGAIAGQGVVYTEPNPAWKIVATGDYNGDGRADLLWRNYSTGQLYMMLVNGLSITSQTMVYTEPNTAWKVLGPLEYAGP